MSVTLMTAFTLLSMTALPAYAWTSNLSTTPLPSASVTVGTSISDQGSLTLTHESATPSGTIYFYLYAGTSSSISGSALYTYSASVGSSNNGATVTYTTGSFSTSSLAAGNYVWLVYYTGGGGWPASTPNHACTFNTKVNNVYGTKYDCEAITLTKTSSFFTTPSPSDVIPVNTPIFDTSSLTLSSGSGTPSGTVYFYLYAGTCASPTGSPLSSSTATVGSSNNGATVQYSSATFPTTGLPAGNYVWLVRYSGGGAWPAFPTSSTGGAVKIGTYYYHCEPISLTTSHGVPEFPIGPSLAIALALPAMMLLRKRGLPRAS
jgi:hypothetical protein